MKIHREYTGTIVENDNGELALAFTKEFLDELGWREGDNIVWDIDETNKVVLVKKE